jgi:hypothetical protein
LGALRLVSSIDHDADQLTMWPVDLRVGNVRNDHPSLIEPVELGVTMSGPSTSTP